MNIVIFGTGEIYRRNKNNISKEDKIIAFLDNNKRLKGTKCDGIEIYSPTEINQLPYDKVIVMSTYCIEMRDQLIQIGCDRESILLYTEYISQQSAGQLRIYYGKNVRHTGKKCLFITTPLEYKGGSMVAVYAALELQDRGYEVIIAASDGQKQFIDAFNKSGITFLLYQNLQFAKWDELFWLKHFDKIIVNTYPMILCAIEVAKHRKVTFWLHESDIVYPIMDFWKDIILDNISMPNLRIYAVSNVARKNFFNNVSECEIGLLPYGIPDVSKTVKKKGRELTFAVIGTIHPIKQQLLFLEAVRQLNKTNQGDEYLIIGSCGDAEYVQKVEREAGEIPNVRITGGLTRKELDELYNQIDIIVVPSSQDCLPLVVAEAMMNEKVCILSDVTGMVQYVNHNENGLIFKSDDVNDLVQQMSYCIENRGILQKLGENARKTYDQYFTLDALGNRLEDILHWQE